MRSSPPTRGIGSCYIGDVMENYEIHRELLGLPPYAFPLGMLCFGYYPDGARPAPRPRFGRQYIAFDEQYRRLDDAELKAMMAGYEARFQAGTAPTDPQNYGQFFYAKKTGSAFMAEMARSVRVALQNWRGEPLEDKRD